MKNRGFATRMGFALAGLREAHLRERSFRAHVRFALAALLALLILQPPPGWWAAVALTVALVTALELINSALEGLIDLLHPGTHPAIKVAKDMLAGAVLVSSIAAVAVGAAMIVATAPKWLKWLTVGIV